jgi:hypothetical protein
MFCTKCGIKEHMPQAQDPRRQQLIANVLSDFERLSMLPSKVERDDHELEPI